MAVDIDELQIEIQSSATSAVSNVDALTNSLVRLRSSAKGGAGLTEIVNRMKALERSANALKSIGSAAGKMQTLANALNSFGRVPDLKSVGRQMTGLSKGVSDLSNAQFNSNKITSISGILSGLSSVGKMQGNPGKQMKSLADGLNALGAVSLSPEKVQSITGAMQAISGIEKASGLASTIKALEKLPDISKALAKADMGTFATQMQQVADAMRPLANEMQKVSAGFAAFPIRIQKIISNNAGLSASNRTTAKSFGVMGTGLSSLQVKFGAYYMGAKRVANIMGGWVQKSNDYVENLNLFTVAMGSGAEEALNYAEKVQDALGIDMSEFIRNQGVFKQITSGFGVVEEKANLMSKNLTQIGYDISSFFNISIEQSMQKVQSGIAGELEPLRRLGYALDVATLQEIAYKHGIDMKVNAMTQAQKSQLRYIAIMQQSENVLGDMARTILTPANAMRILQQQINRLGRALGNLLIPMLIQIVPYVQAFVEVLTEAVQRLANLFGFELPKIDYSDVNGLGSSAEDADTALGDAAKAAKELKNATLGIDELNVIAPQAASGGTGAGGVAGGDLGVTLPEYDFLGKLQEQTKKIKKQMEEVLDVVLAVGAGLLAWKITSSVISAVSDLQGNLAGIKSLKLGAGIVLAVTGFTLEFNGFSEIGSGEADIYSYLKGFGGATLGAAGVKLIMSALGISGPIGWVIGIAASLAVAITAITISANKAALKRDMEARFGELGLTEEEISEWAGSLTTSELTVKLNLFVSEQTTLSSLKTQVENVITELNGLNFRAKIGIEVSEDAYKTAVDKFVFSSQEYLQQKQIVATMAIDILLDGTETGESLSEFATVFYGENSAKLDELGRNLKSVVSTGFENGKWIPDKLKQAVELQKQIQEVLDYISTVEFGAKLEALRLDARGTDLTVESFEGIMTQAQETIQTQMDNLKDVRLESLKIAKMQFDQNVLDGMSKDAAQDIYTAAKSAADKAFREKSVEINNATFTFGINTISDAFADEIANAQPALSMSIADTLSDAFKGSMEDESYIIGGSIRDFVFDVQSSFKSELNSMDITTDARKNMESLIKTLQPTAENLEKIAKSAREAGQSVPDYVAKGLNDINQLKAITDNTDGILYTIGAKLSTDTKFLETLTIAENAGKEIDKRSADGLLNNLKVVEDAANGTITLMNDTIGSKTLEITPTLVQNLKDLGVHLSDGLLKGADEQMQANKKSWLDWAIWPWNRFKEKNEIESPSKLFKRGGGFIMQGLFDGMSGWEEDFKGIFRTIVNGGITLFNGFIDWMNEKMRFAWDAVNILGKEIIPAGSVQLFTIPHIPSFATGGFPEQGQYFRARENGPEMVGTIGSRTAVANNDQITTGIRTAVYDAMMSAMGQRRESGNGGEASINIYLDGKQITASVEKRQRERGVSIMSGGVLIGV